MIPSKVQLAVEVSNNTTGVNFPVNDDEVIEVDDAGLRKLQQQQQREQQQQQSVEVEWWQPEAS